MLHHSFSNRVTRKYKALFAEVFFICSREGYVLFGVDLFHPTSFFCLLLLWPKAVIK